MGEWVNAYLESKDAEIGSSWCPCKYDVPRGDPYEYHRSKNTDRDIPDYFQILTPIKNSCWGCRNHVALTGYCGLDFSICLGAGKHTCKHYEPHKHYRWQMVWSMIYRCWRLCFVGNEVGFKKWMLTEEGKKYYKTAEQYLIGKGVLVNEDKISTVA